MSEREAASDNVLREIARILAAGILRLHMRQVRVAEPSVKKSSESGQNGLEVSDKTVLTVHTG